MKASTRNVFKTLPSELTIDQQTTVNAWLPQLDKTNILNTISHLSTNYTNRYYQYTSGQQSAQWIRDLWAGYAGSRSDVTVTTYNHGSYVQPSVILEISGNSLSSEVVVLGGHLDSIKSGGMTTSTVAPGADDAGKGTEAGDQDNHVPKGAGQGGVESPVVCAGKWKHQIGPVRKIRMGRVVIMVLHLRFLDSHE